MSAPSRNRPPDQRREAAAPPPTPRPGALQWIAIGLLAVSTLSLLATAVLLGLLFTLVKDADVAPLQAEIAGLKGEVAAFHGDVGKSMAAMQKEVADTRTQVNSATLLLNDIGLSLKKP